jgi:hypothetical protein
MLLDLDVVWLQPPDSLFNSQTYAKTGALFFRDRTYDGINSNRRGDDERMVELFRSHGLGRTDEEVQALTTANGISFFWLYQASKLPGGKPFKQLSELQDSSVVLVNRGAHPKLLAVLTELLPTFDYGYGDKEIFWIAATMAKENFTLSPFLAGQYGDCYGVILHFHPDDAADPANARLLYINAEYFVEHETTAVGDFISSLRTKALLATAKLAEGSNMGTWVNGLKRGEEGCTCRHFPCESATNLVNQHMLFAQWLTLTMRLTKQSDVKECVPVKVKHVKNLARALQLNAKPHDCHFVGCPLLPMTIDSNASWSLSGRFCDPVHFLAAAPADLPELAAEARRPNSAYNMPPTKDNTPIQCDMDRQLFLYSNSTARPFNSWSAFVSRGFDLDNVVRIPKWQCDNIPLGEPLN